MHMNKGITLPGVTTIALRRVVLTQQPNTLDPLAICSHKQDVDNVLGFLTVVQLLSSISSPIILFGRAFTRSASRDAVFGSFRSNW